MKFTFKKSIASSISAKSIDKKGMQKEIISFTL